MKTYLLFLCLLGCTRLFLVVGVVPWRDIERLQNALRGIGFEKDAGKERSALISDDREGVRPDINPHGVEIEEVDNPTSTNGTAGTNSTTSQLTTVDITPTATTSATSSSSTVANRTTSVPAILPTATVNRTSTRGPATSTSPTNTPNTKSRGDEIGLIVGCVVGGILLMILCMVAFLLIWKYRETIKKCCSTKRKDDTTSESSDEEGVDDYAECFRSFLDQHPEYQEQRHKRRDLGSRVQKHWYQVEMKDNGQEKKIVTIAPVSQSCPLKLHKHQSGLNKLLGVVKKHPYLHPIELVEYLPDHELLVMVQPLMSVGSLKDKIYKAAPLTNWSKKYARRSSGLRSEKIARYGRQILEAMKFLYSKGFPTLGHIQSGNIFVVNDVCHLGGYENTLLGYKTRLFRLCKDELEHFDVILFGHLVFEMAAGYELTHLRPLEAEYKTVDKSVRPILEYIFEEGFPHDVNTILSHEFFSGSSELNDFDPSQVQLSKSMNKVLEKVHKGKPRVQKNRDGIEVVVAKVKTTFRDLKQKLGRGGEDSKGDLEEKPAESQKEVGRGGEASAGNVEERSPKNQKTLKSTYGGAGKDLEGAQEKKPAKSQKKLKMKGMKPGLTEPLLGDKAN